MDARAEENNGIVDNEPCLERDFFLLCSFGSALTMNIPAKVSFLLKSLKLAHSKRGLSLIQESLGLHYLGGIWGKGPDRSRF